MKIINLTIGIMELSIPVLGMTWALMCVLRRDWQAATLFILVATNYQLIAQTRQIKNAIDKAADKDKTE